MTVRQERDGTSRLRPDYAVPLVMSDTSLVEHPDILERGWAFIDTRELPDGSYEGFGPLSGTLRAESLGVAQGIRHRPDYESVFVWDPTRIEAEIETTVDESRVNEIERALKEKGYEELRLGLRVGENKISEFVILGFRTLPQ